MTDFVAAEPTWVVLDDLAQLLTVDTGQQFTTGHPCHIFTDEAEAIAYAISMGWEPDDLTHEAQAWAAAGGEQ